MILNIILLSALAWTTSKCEPPIISYLPPSSNSGGRPSSQYGTPGAGGGVSGTNRPGSGTVSQQNSPQDNYLPPGQSGQSNTPDREYGQPSRGFGQGPSSPQRGFGPSRFPQGQGNDINAPSSQYGTPGQRGTGPSRTSSNQSGNNLSHLQSTIGGPNRGPGFTSAGSESEAFASAGAGFGQRPDSSYGPPTTGGFQSPNGQSTNGRPGAQGSDSSYPSATGLGRLGSSPSSEYGQPGFGRGSSANLQGGGRGSNFEGNDYDEPAKYEFSYDVDDSLTGTKFGHSEQRDGDLATGEYNVLLPDGRKQVVEYEAGLQGYKPQIRYEGNGGGTGSNFGPGSGGPQNGNQGYSHDSPGSGFPGSDSDTGYPGSGQGNQLQQPQRNQEAGGFDQGESQSGRGNGYPRGGPNGRGPNGQSSRGYPSGGLRQGGGNGQTNSQAYPGTNDPETLNGGTQGYPRGGTQGGNGGYSNGPRGGNTGYPNGGSQNIGRSTGGDDGYPSGAPSGPRGSGY